MEGYQNPRSPEDPDGLERRRSRSGGPTGSSGDGPSSVADGAPETATPAPEASSEAVLRAARVQGRRKRRGGLQLPAPRTHYTPEERLLILDTWRRSALPARDFAVLVNVSAHTLYGWAKKFAEQGPAGLSQPVRVGRGRVDEVTRRAILMVKEQNPDYGCQRISDLLLRGPGMPASPQTVSAVLKDAGYVLVEAPTKPHAPLVTRFERGRPNELWQTDLFTFVLKRQNRRVYLVVFMDDHSRYVVSYSLMASQSTALVLDAFRTGIANYGPPDEVLTDNGTQYVTWRGKSQFAAECEKLGVRHIVARPRHPETLGKAERFWGTLWREFLEAALFADLADAAHRIGLFISHYNLRRPHQGIGGLVPADRFFAAAPQVKAMLEERSQANALEVARHGEPKQPFYLTGQVGGQGFSVHAEGERLILTKEGQRQEIELTSPTPAAPGVPGDGVPSGASTVLPSVWQQSVASSPVAPSSSVLDGFLADEVGHGQG